MADQLAFEVDPACAVRIVERRGGEERTQRVGPQAEPEARPRASVLLFATAPRRGSAPGRGPVAGGVRVVSLERIE